MRICLAALLIFSCALHAVEPELHVVSLFDMHSRIPNALIPFRVEGSLLAGGRLDSVTVTVPTNQNCRAMIDPYLKTTFLLKCLAAAEVHMKVRVVNGWNVYEINYGPVSVTEPFSNVVIVPPGPGPTEDPAILAGRQLFMAYCKRCHLPQQKPDRTAAVLRSALQAIPDMKSLDSTLSADDLSKISKYLGGF